MTSRSFCSLSDRDFCQKDTANLVCAHTEVLIIERAAYGRMRAESRCVQDASNIGCHSDVTSIAKEDCEGRGVCVFPVSDYIHKVKADPCPADYTAYLQLRYRCQPGELS